MMKNPTARIMKKFMLNMGGDEDEDGEGAAGKDGHGKDGKGKDGKGGDSTRGGASEGTPFSMGDYSSKPTWSSRR